MKYLLFLVSFISFAQTDFKTCDANISISPTDKRVNGVVSYTFEVVSKPDTISIDAVNMDFSDLKINGKVVKFVTSAKALKLYQGFKKGKNKVQFRYVAKPRQTMYFVGEKDNLQIWTQGQGKYTSHWLPSFDDMNEKVVFNLSVTFDKDFEVISNGTLANKTQSDVSATWDYKMDKPMSSYLAMIAIGKFSKKVEKSASGKDLVMYYRSDDESKVAATYKYSKEMFDFFEREIGVEYPWGNYKQVPVRDFLYAGMENTSATVFAQDFVVDDIAFNDKDYINVNAHELAHQWFGDMVTAKSGKHHWLQEGFATYYALLAERSIYGEDHFNFKLYEMAVELQRVSAKDSVPILDEKASSLTYYKKGAWALHVLREEVGDAKFNKAVKTYLEKYAYKNVDTNMFLAEIDKVSDYDTKAFSKKWLDTGGFEVGDAIAILKRNPFMTKYFDLLALEPVPFQEKKEQLAKILQSDENYRLKELAVFQTANVPFDEKVELLRLALQTDNIKVRQAVASSAGKIPLSFYPEFVTLIGDRSYHTQGMVLTALWEQFPEKQMELLDKTKNAIGFNDKNLRIQWLTLALGTRGFEPADKLKFYEELLDYATAKYESSIRQNALENLLFFNPNDTNVLALLVNPLTHHKWQFSLFARGKIREKLKKEIYKDHYSKLLPSLSENERLQLQRLLNEK